MALEKTDTLCPNCNINLVFTRSRTQMVCVGEKQCGHHEPVTEKEPEMQIVKKKPPVTFADPVVEETPIVIKKKVDPFDPTVADTMVKAMADKIANKEVKRAKEERKRKRAENASQLDVSDAIAGKEQVIIVKTKAVYEAPSDTVASINRLKEEAFAKIQQATNAFIDDHIKSVGDKFLALYLSRNNAGDSIEAAVTLTAVADAFAACGLILSDVEPRKPTPAKTKAVPPVASVAKAPKEQPKTDALKTLTKVQREVKNAKDRARRAAKKNTKSTNTKKTTKKGK